MEYIKKLSFNCVVIDFNLSDMPGVELVKLIKAQKGEVTPIIMYASSKVKKSDLEAVHQFSETTPIKDVYSTDHLLDETSLFLHQVESNLAPNKQKILKQLHQNDAGFKGKKVLVVDDDARNIFALKSALENEDIIFLEADNGRTGVEMIKQNPDISFVLMDIMMPEMDGYEAMKQIRRLDEFKSLPIVALTAKAMKGDRNKCIEAGASDYISKPVDIPKLKSLMKVWMYDRK